MCLWQRFGTGALKRNAQLTYNLIYGKYISICSLLNSLNYVKSRVHESKYDKGFGCIHRNVPIRFVGITVDHGENDTEDLSDNEIDPGYERMREMSEKLRNFLYPDSDDPILLKLKDCVSIQGVFDIIKSNESDLTSQHVSQAVLVLWDLQKIFYNVYVKEETESVTTGSTINMSASLRNYIDVVRNHEDFQNLIKLVNRTYLQMNPDAASCTVLYLRKMDVCLTLPVMQNLITHCASQMSSSTPSNFPLTALSRFTVAVHIPKSIWSHMILKDTIPFIDNAIDRCETIEELHYITVCMKNTWELLHSSFVERYKEKTVEVVSRTEITTQNIGTILKSAVFLNLLPQPQRNTYTIKCLLMTLKGKISELSSQELIRLHKVLFNQMEPADLLSEIKEHARELLSRINTAENVSPEKPEAIANLISCIISFSPPLKKSIFEKLGRQHIENEEFSMPLPSMFRLLWHLKTTDKQLYDTFWKKHLHELKHSETERDVHTLLQTAYRYMHFINKLGLRYRHFGFERNIIHWLLSELEHGVAGVVPSEFAVIAAFLLAYGGTFQEVIDESLIPKVVDKISDMMPQFTAIDCLNLSRGFHIGMKVHYRKPDRNNLLNQFAKVNSVLNTCSLRHLTEENLNIVTLNVIGRAFINPKGVSQTDILESILQRYNECDDPLSSRLIREAVWNFRSFDCLAPAMVERMVEYIIHNKVHVLAETAEKLLTLCYVHGYNPSSAMSFFSTMSDLILRDKDIMVTLSVIRSALALCYYNSLPMSLIHHIFTVDFLERIEAELLLCYSKDVYPFRVRHTLMKLNRAVCLDYPDADVPWFHKKYCQEIMATGSKKQSVFHQDVLSHLIAVMGGKQFVEVDAYSPYSYKIDFQLLLDAENNPVNHRSITDKGISKIAILLLRDEAFSGDLLKGPYQLRQRHLEMMGYRVIGIPARLWQSMFMAEPQAKVHFLEKCIFQKNKS